MTNKETKNAMERSDAEKRTARRARRSRGLKVTLITTASVLAIAVVSVIIYSIYYKLNHASFEEYKMYQYFSGLKVEYDGTLTLAYDGRVTNMSYGDVEIEADSTPIYFQNIDNEVVLPTNMELVIPRIKNTTYKINYFSKVSYEIYEDEVLGYLTYRDKGYALEDSFLFDGDGLYLFIFGATVTVGEETIQLSPLSYMRVDYHGDVEIYDKASDTFRTIENVMTDVVATMDGYAVNMSTDSIRYDNGSNRLLIKSVDSLPTYEGQN